MTTNLLIFFAIPLAIVVISIALQKNLENPFLVAAIIFSVLLIIVLAFFEPIFLIAVVAYTILSFITAVLTCFICRFFKNRICDILCNNCNNNDDENLNNNVISVSNSGNIGIEGSHYSAYNTNNLCNGESSNYNNIISSSSYNSNNGFSEITDSYAHNYNRRR